MKTKYSVQREDHFRFFIEPEFVGYQDESGFHGAFISELRGVVYAAASGDLDVDIDDKPTINVYAYGIDSTVKGGRPDKRAGHRLVVTGDWRFERLVELTEEATDPALSMVYTLARHEVEAAKRRQKERDADSARLIRKALASLPGDEA